MGGHKTKPGGAIPRGSRVGTRAVGTFAGGKSSRRALAAVVVLSADIALGRELAESGMVAEILAAKALGSRILGLEILHEDPKMEQARKGTERRLDIGVMRQNPKGHEVSGTNARIISDRTPHLANSRNSKALGRETIHDVVSRRVSRETTKNRLGDMTDNRVVSKELEVIGSSRAEEGFILRQ